MEKKQYQIDHGIQQYVQLPHILSQSNYLADTVHELLNIRLFLSLNF